MGRKRSLLSLLSLLLIYSQGSAFSPTDRPFVVSRLTIELTGQVLDDQQKPLPGATVSVVGTTIGTTTNENGVYRLSLPDEYAGRSLTFSYIGFTKQTVLIGQERTINVTLAVDSNQSLDEVVVVGYGRQDKLSVTGAVDQIKKLFELAILETRKPPVGVRLCAATLFLRPDGLSMARY